MVKAVNLNIQEVLGKKSVVESQFQQIKSSKHKFKFLLKTQPQKYHETTHCVKPKLENSKSKPQIQTLKSCRKPVCRFFRNGLCKDGTHCKFRHVKDESRGVSVIKKTRPDPKEKKDPRFCRFYQEGHCRDGDDCKYFHVKVSETKRCRFYEKGRCKEEEKCKYLHIPKETDNKNDVRVCRFYARNGNGRVCVVCFIV